MKPLASYLPSISQHLVVAVVSVLVYVLTTRARHERRAPTSAIAWVMGLALLPYLTLPAYLLFGRRKLRPPPRLPAAREGPPLNWAAELVESFGLAAPARCRVRMHADGAVAEAALWDVIAGATTRLDVCTFIIGNDALGREVVERLAARARAGVQVRVLLDGFGALLLHRHALRPLQLAGGQTAVFRPFFGRQDTGPRNLRNHRKLVVADDTRLWAGGRNLAAEYFCGAPGKPAWHDLSFDLDGPVAAAAAGQFEADWAAVHARIPRAVAEPPPAAGGAMAQFLPSGPDQPEDTAQSLLVDACFRATRRIVAVTPYFLPNDPLRDAMRLAARRGVQVTIAIPARSNHRLADFVRARAMRDLARAGVAFAMLPSMAHAKAVVVDDVLAMCGSINLDLRSLLLNHEDAVLFYEAAQIDWLCRWITALAATGRPFDARAPGLLRDVAEGLLLTVAFQV